MTPADTPLALADATAAPTAPVYRSGAPNVVVVVLDDLGFAQLGCYGSNIETPNLDRLAARGTRFTNFHTTAVCSPTRACLLTGRNHHRVGMGMLPDMPINFPGYSGEFPPSAGTMADILRSEGWGTFAIGKWHLVPRDQRAAGPFHMWPTGVGFDRYYGFLNGETNQWTPNLIRDQHHIEPPTDPEHGYHLDADLADEAIAHIHEHRLSNPERPFLLWYASGTPHAPHQAPPEWLDLHKGRFDGGWDAWRENALARQKEMGITPDGTTLSERPEWVEEWDSIDADRQRLYIRMMEVYAGFLSHADHHIGRVIDYIESIGETDNTIVAVISDNGCSAEGGPNGSWNQIRHYISDEPDDIDLELSHYDDLGGFKSSGHYPWGWALAGNAPFRRWKRYTFEGGVRDPLIISWPGGLGDQGSLRHQYCHVTDIMPTLLDLLDLEPPSELRGVAQMSLDGVSLRQTLAEATAADPRSQQYYECWGSRAIYRDGWKAVTNHVNQLTRAERDAIVGSHDFAEDRWELFDTRNDFTESNDLAETQPEKLAELVALWHEEAERNNVLPIDDSAINRIMRMHMPWSSWRSHYVFSPGDKIHEAVGPLAAAGYRVVASFTTPLESGVSGTVVEQGDWISGWALYLDGQGLVWAVVSGGREYRVHADLPDSAQFLAVSVSHGDPGEVEVVFEANGEQFHAETIRVELPSNYAPDGAFMTIGYSRPFPVTDDYTPPFRAPSSLARVTFDVGNPPPFDFDLELEHVMRHQ